MHGVFKFFQSDHFALLCKCKNAILLYIFMPLLCNVGFSAVVTCDAFGERQMSCVTIFGSVTVYFVETFQDTIIDNFSIIR